MWYDGIRGVSHRFSDARSVLILDKETACKSDIFQIIGEDYRKYYREFNMKIWNSDANSAIFTAMKERYEDVQAFWKYASWLYSRVDENERN